MKFHCERCKTKYSISDDRVRGKILKIRCKNCSSVITVRESKAAAPAIPAKAKRPLAQGAAAVRAAGTAKAKAGQAQKPSAGQAALAGALRQAVNEPESSSANMRAQSSPVSLEAEWYLSKDGQQEGPFSMDAAHAWVANKSPDDDLYCWSEGFDDWLPTEKISHFRGIRAGSFSDLGGPDEQTMIEGMPFVPPVETPKPLFAATMAAVAENESVDVDDEFHLPPSSAALAKSAAVAKPAAAAPPIPGKAVQAAPMFASPTPVTPDPTPAAAAAPAPAMDLAIGEASRVVDLAALMANRGNAPAITPSGGPLPGIGGRPFGAGTGMAPALTGAPDGLPGAQLAPLGGLGPNRKKRTGLLLTLLGASIVIALGTGILVYVMQGSGDEKRLVRGSVGGSGNLGHSNNTGRPGTAVGTTTPGEVQTVDPAVIETKTGKVRRPIGTRTPKTPKTPKDTSKPSGEVDLSNSSTALPTGPLDPEEFMQMVRKRDYGMKMCYERSLKKDPLLKVPKSNVDIRIGRNGKVTSVKVAGLTGTALGTCLAKYIKRWKFRETTEVFSGQFPLLFGR